MVSLKPLEAVGYNQAFFRLSEEGILEKEFTYYTFDNVYPPAFENYWNLVGVHHRTGDVSLVDVQFVYVDDDSLSLEDFETLQMASSILYINPSELLALIQFFEDIVGYQVTDENSIISHFHLLGPDELIGLHFKQWAINMYTGHCYCYIPDQKIQNAATILLFNLPQWTQQQKMMQSAMLEFTTFEKRQLADPKFSPFDVHGLATVTFTQQSLEEFVLLLKQHTYETALQAFQS